MPAEAAALESRDAAAVALEERFSALVASHRERALRLAWRLVGGDEAAAEDVAQEAFVSAYRALPRFRGDARLETWFYRILVNQAHRYRRWRTVRERWRAAWVAEPPAPPVGPGDPGLRRRIGAALLGLTRRQREVFVWVHLEGFGVGECAELLGLTTGSVKSHLHRARTKLRSELADLRGPDGGISHDSAR